MKKVILGVLAILISLTCISTVGAITAVSNGCYVCTAPNMYVKFEGKDSKALQKKALAQFGCKVYAVIDHCSSMTDADGTTMIEGPVR